MTSLQSDTVVTPLADAARDLLPLVSGAAARLAVSRHVPDDLPGVVETVFDRLPEPALAEAGGVDPYLVEALTYGVMRCYRALTLPPARARRELRVGLEQVRQALAYIVEEAPTQDDRPATQLATWLVATLNSPLREIAEVLGVNLRTLQRWTSGDSSPSGEEAFRLRAVARLVNNLRHALTGEGVLLWLREPHPDLRGRPPMALLAPATFPRLLVLASRARSNVFA